MYRDALSCSSDQGAALVCYVSKMFAVPRRSLPSTRTVDEVLPSIDHEVLLGFARIFCGVIQEGMQIIAILPKYDTSLPASHARNKDHIAVCRVDSLFTMMGRELVPITEVRAGNVFAIGGLQGTVWRSATICGGEPRVGAVVDLEEVERIDGFINLGRSSTHVEYLDSAAELLLN